MAIINRATLKTYFETGDTPTQSQFADLIDSLLAIEIADTGLTAISALGGTSKIVVIDAGDHNMYYTTVADILSYLNAHDTTDNLAEGSTNLYFTDARVRTALSAGTGLSYNSSTGVFTINASTTNVSEGANLYYTDTRARAAISKSGNELSYNNSTGVIGKNKAIQALADGTPITFDVSAGYNAVITLVGNRTLAISNAIAGEYYTLKVVQDATGGHSLALPGTCKVIGGGAGAVSLTPAAGAVDILTFYYNGTNYYVNYGLNYN
jgi:hypothetical protein